MIAAMEYTQGFRKHMVRKMLPPMLVSATALAKERGAPGFGGAVTRHR